MTSNTKGRLHGRWMTVTSNSPCEGRNSLTTTITGTAWQWELINCSVCGMTISVIRHISTCVKNQPMVRVKIFLVN